AELIEIKELAWLARDGVGLERTALIDGINSKVLAGATLTKANDLRSRAEVTWGVVRELAERPGVPAEVVAAIEAAHTESFGTYEQIRRPLYDALVNGRPPTLSSDELIARSNLAVDRLMEVSNTAMTAAERQAASRQAAADNSLLWHGALLVLGLLVSLA